MVPNCGASSLRLQTRAKNRGEPKRSKFIRSCQYVSDAVALVSSCGGDKMSRRGEKIVCGPERMHAEKHSRCVAASAPTPSGFLAGDQKSSERPGEGSEVLQFDGAEIHTGFAGRVAFAAHLHHSDNAVAGHNGRAHNFLD